MKKINLSDEARITFFVLSLFFVIWGIIYFAAGKAKYDKMKAVNEYGYSSYKIMRLRDYQAGEMRTYNYYNNGDTILIFKLKE